VTIDQNIYLLLAKCTKCVSKNLNLIGIFSFEEYQKIPDDVTSTVDLRKHDVIGNVTVK